MLTEELSNKLKKFYGKRVQHYIDHYNKGTIAICPKCHKVDIDVLKHPEECSPEMEIQRQESLEYYK